MTVPTTIYIEYRMKKKKKRVSYTITGAMDVIAFTLELPLCYGTHCECVRVCCVSLKRRKLKISFVYYKKKRVDGWDSEERK